MDAWREGDTFVIEFDLPGVRPETVDIDVERNVLTVKAERARRNGDWETLASERPTGLFSRQLVLGDNLDLDSVEAELRRGRAAAHRAGRREGEAPQDRGRRERLGPGRALRLTHARARCWSAGPVLKGEGRGRFACVARQERAPVVADVGSVCTTAAADAAESCRCRALPGDEPITTP